MMMLVSGIDSPRALSCSTGILPIGHRSCNWAADVASAKSTRLPVKGVSFSYSATRTLWQNEDRGWKYNVRAMGPFLLLAPGGYRPGSA
ncbi:hypothetical protein D3C86_1356420 [compost metagenome]